MLFAYFVQSSNLKKNCIDFFLFNIIILTAKVCQQTFLIQCLGFLMIEAAQIEEEANYNKEYSPRELV